MKLRLPLATGLLICLPLDASRAAIYPYAEYHLGEAGSLLGTVQLPQDSSGQGRHLHESSDGAAAIISSATPPAAVGSTACLDTRMAGDQGWDAYFSNYSYEGSLPVNNFAFGVFAQAPAYGTSNGSNIFALGTRFGAFGLALGSNGWRFNLLQIGFSSGDPGTFTPNTWVHLAVIRTGDISTFYINGVAQSFTHTSVPRHGTPVIAGGSPFAVGPDFNGLIDEARVVTFSQGETPARIIAALQAGAVPTAFITVGNDARYRKASLSPDETSVFRLGGPVRDSVTILDPGALEVAGTAPQKHLIRIAKEGPIAPGRYPLISFTGSIGGLGFAGLELADIPGRFTEVLEHNIANSTIDLVITGPDGITWTGSGGDVWEVEGAANWVLDGTATPAQFIEGDDVTFDNTTATTANIISIAEPVSPLFLTVDSDGNHTFQGAAIGGSTILTKRGTGTLTLGNANTSTGAIAIHAGTLSVGDGGATGSLGSGDITLDGGLLAVNRSGDDLHLPNRITGTGGIRKLGTGSVVLGSPDSDPNRIIYLNSFTGPVTITAGEVVSAGESCFGSPLAGTTIETGASFDVAGIGAGEEPFTIHGHGVNNEGAIKNNRGTTNPAGIKGDLVLGSDSSIGGSSDWRGPRSITGNYKLTKVGSNRITVWDAAITLKDITITSGSLLLAGNVSLNDTTPGTIAIDGGTLAFATPDDFAVGTYCVKPIILNSGSITTIFYSYRRDGVRLASPVQITSDAPIRAEDGCLLRLDGTVSGSGEFVKEGTGQVEIAKAPAYTGNTTVRSGLLMLRLPGMNDASTVTVADGAKLGLNFLGVVGLGRVDRVDKLFLGGVQQAAGFYGYQTHPGHFQQTYFNGYLLVTNGMTGTNYEIWAEMNGIAGADPDADPDQDGIINAIEFVIGGKPVGPASNSLAQLPILGEATNGDPQSKDFIFRRNFLSKESARVEYASSLDGDWTTAVNNVDGVDIFENHNHYGPGIDRVIVRLPTTSKTKLFARLRVAD